MDDNIRPEDLKYILNHLFLPPKLPQRRDEQTRWRDVALLSFLHDASLKFIYNLKSSALFSGHYSYETWATLSRMLGSMATLHSRQNLTQQEVQTALQSMEVNGKGVNYPF